MSLKYKLRVLTGRAGFSLWNTLKVNFRVFPFAVARKLPVKAGHRLDMKGLYRGCIQLREGVSPHKYMVRLGVSPWPLYSPRSMRTFLWFHAGARLVLGDEVDINAGCRFVITAHAAVEVGSHFFINHCSLVYCSRSIRFGEHCTVGWECQVYDSDFHLCADTVGQVVHNPVRPVEVGDNVWIANRTTLSKGAVVPSHSVVASHSLVGKDLRELIPSSASAGYLFAGIPAALIRTGIEPVCDKRTESRLRRQFSRTDVGSLPLPPPSATP